MLLECGREDARRKPASELPLSRGEERSLSTDSRPACESGSFVRASLRDRIDSLALTLSGQPLAVYLPSAVFDPLRSGSLSEASVRSMECLTKTLPGRPAK